MLVEYLSKPRGLTPLYIAHSFFREIVLSFPGTSLLSLVRKYYPPPAPSQQNRFSSSICFDIKVKTLLRQNRNINFQSHILQGPGDRAGGEGEEEQDFQGRGVRLLEAGDRKRDRGRFRGVRLRRRKPLGAE